jgi:hypothetical protein
LLQRRINIDLLQCKKKKKKIWVAYLEKQLNPEEQVTLKILAEELEPQALLVSGQWGSCLSSNDKRQCDRRNAFPNVWVAPPKHYLGGIPEGKQHIYCWHQDGKAADPMGRYTGVQVTLITRPRGWSSHK